MKPFPQEWELFSLFECEPVLDDPGIPWAYNRLTFDTMRGSDRIVCVIEPGYERLHFSWWRDQILHLTLNVAWVQGLAVLFGWWRGFPGRHLS